MIIIFFATSHEYVFFHVDHDSIEGYNLMISYSKNQSNTKCADAATEHKIANLTFNAVC